MARIRNIKPDFFMSEDIGSLTVSSRLLYIALWGHADREGRMKFQRVALAAQTMPFEMQDFDKCLEELVGNNHVVKYTVENKNYLYIPMLTEHQRFHKTEKESSCPAPNNAPLTVKQPLDNALEGEGGKRRGKGRGSESGAKKFTRPTVNEIYDYFLTRSFDEIQEAEKMFDFYEAKGWKVGKSTMKDWKAACRNWIRGKDDFKPKPPAYQNTRQPNAMDRARETLEPQQPKMKVIN